ncbi:MAG: TetR/AcrR family transcriptional regulator [Bacteroidales bacterium]|nr:TetR/AcrR family transcriptional regulator [Bacteroidales bacterium]MDD4656271.1 TetR/AcrR family transcriptional regulator [Bacteroidales bacterium]
MISARQQEIIDATIMLINSKGIQGFTIKNISKIVGVSEPAIYRHFQSKTAILVTLLDLLKENSSKIYGGEINLEGSVISNIERIFESHFATFAKMPSLSSVVFSEELFRNDKSLTGKISEVIDFNNKIFLSYVVEGQKRGELRDDVDASHIVTMLMGSLRLFVKKWQFSEFNFDLVSNGKLLTSSLIQLISKK